MKKFLLFILLSTILVGCKKESSLLDYKTEYVGDASKVSQIVDKQNYKEGISTHGIEIESSNKPYGLVVNLKTTEGIYPEDLIDNAAVTFALIDNLDDLTYRLEEGDIKFHRDGVEEYLEKEGYSYEKLCSSGDEIEKLLER